MKMAPTGALKKRWGTTAPTATPATSAEAVLLPGADREILARF